LCRHTKSTGQKIRDLVKEEGTKKKSPQKKGRGALKNGPNEHRDVGFHQTVGSHLSPGGGGTPKVRDKGTSQGQGPNQKKERIGVRGGRSTKWDKYRETKYQKTKGWSLAKLDCKKKKG